MMYPLTAENNQRNDEFSRAFHGSRSADHVRRLSKSHGSSGFGSGSVPNIPGRVGSGQAVLKIRGLGRVTLTRPDPRKTLNFSWHDPSSINSTRSCKTKKYCVSLIPSGGMNILRRGAL